MFSSFFTISFIVLLSGVLFSYYVQIGMLFESERSERFALLTFSKENLWMRKYLKVHYGVNLELKRVTLNDSLDDLGSYDVLIPALVDEAIAIGGLNLSNVGVTSPKLIHELDDKNEVSSILQPEFRIIPEIPTISLQQSTAHLQVTKKVTDFLSKAGSEIICKPSDSLGSRDQTIFSNDESAEQTILDLESNNICQPYMKKHDKYGLNIFAEDGRIVSWMCGKAEGGLPREKYEQGYFTRIVTGTEDAKERNYLKQMTTFTKSTVARLGLKGILEFEFLLHNEKLYFLEINPRISGVIDMVDRNFRSPYIDKIIIPYISSRTCSLNTVNPFYDFHTVNGTCCYLYRYGISKWKELGEDAYCAMLTPTAECSVVI